LNWVLALVIGFVAGAIAGGITAYVVFGSYGGGQTSG